MSRVATAALHPVEHMFISLLFLIILAVMAHQSKKIVLSAVLFGGLKAIASCYYVTEVSYEIAVLVGVTQFVVNGLLGLGIAYLVVKHSQEWKYTFATTILSLLTFITAILDRAIVA